MSVAVLATLTGQNVFAALKATKFPGTFNDVPFSQRVATKAAGYEPYKDATAYVVPKFLDTDDEFKRQMCERDHAECCRRWPTYKDCVKKVVPDPDECPDPNMDEDCECTGRGMDPESAKTGKCTCVSSRASVKNKKCVCDDDPTLDPTTDCTKVLPPEPTVCDDPEHMDDKCNCKPVAGITTKTGSDGMCACTDTAGNIDLGANIDNDCKCKAGEKDPADGICKCKVNGKFDMTVSPLNGCKREYVLIQCRSDHIDELINKAGAYHTMGTILRTQLKCSQSKQDSIDKCFAPCDKTTSKTPYINENVLKGVIPPFCTGNWGDDMHTNEFRLISEPTSYLLYSRQQVDDVMNAITSSDYDDCGTDRFWYIIGLHRDSDGNFKYYLHKQIGK